MSPYRSTYISICKRYRRTVTFKLLFMSSLIFSHAGFSEGDVDESLEGRNYYLMEVETTCKANAPGKPTILTWEDRLEFSDTDVLIWGKLCNDNAKVIAQKDLHLQFNDDRTELVYEGSTYFYYQDTPQLCDQGTWCVMPIKEISK